jgi:hypothetical protein
MKITSLLVVALLLVGCDSQSTTSKVMTYSELYDYPVSCSLKDIQLKELTALQRQLNFDPDPDMLSEFNRAYNSRLKATIWWYAYRCDQS